MQELRDRRFRPVRLTTVTSRERLVLSLIRREGDITRSDLIAMTELPGAAIFRVTEDLAARGLIELGAGIANGPGKPSTLVKLRANALATIGLSVMTDFAEAVLLDFSGEVRAARNLTVPGMGCDDVLDRLVRFIEEEASATGFPSDAIVGLGVAFAGFFIGDGDKMNPAAPLDDWALKDIGAIAARKTGLTVDVENIANAAAVGERLLGVGRWADSLAYINLSHGLGAGLILDGDLFRGRHGNAGEIAAMLGTVNLPVPNLESLRDALGAAGVSTANVSDLVDRFDPAWPAVETWLDWAAPSFTFLCALFRQTLDCDAIVLGGRLPAGLADRIIAKIHWPDEAGRPRRDVGLPLPRIVAAEVDARSAAIGAASIPLRHGYFQ